MSGVGATSPVPLAPSPEMQTPATPVAPPPPAPYEVVVGVPGSASPRDVYRAAVAQRDELQRQLDNLKSERRSTSSRLQSNDLSDVDRQGLEGRLKSLDERISGMDRQIAQADAQVAGAAGIPGAAVREPPAPRQGPPEEFYILGMVFMFVVAMPIAIGYARRLWKRGVQTVMALPAELGERLTRMEQAMDAIAVEVERVGESQRYVTRLMQDGGARALGAGAAEPIEVRAREALEERRR